MLTLLNPAEVEQRLAELIAKHKAKHISVPEIKRKIFESDSDDSMTALNRFLKWWSGCFRGVENDDFEKLLQTFQDAWNSFPHSSLAGKSPQQVLQEEMKKHPEVMETNARNPMPDVTVGGVTMPWDDYQNMIKQMEKQQKPFKRWIEKTALLAYKKYLETRHKTQKTVEKHYDVADYFFHRALHVGFLDYEKIRPAFAVWEFPAWWPDHILDSNLTEDQVWSSLCDFLWFAEIILHRSIPEIWEEAAGEGSSEA